MDKNIKKGFVYGLLATLAMTILMLISVATKISPMPAPIPVALAKMILGTAPKPALFITGMILHFLYGGIAGSIFAKLFTKKNIINGLIYGGILWLIMQVIFLPILGWGFFGVSITLKIAVATLVLHLVYGLTIGCLFERNTKKGGVNNE